YIDFSSLSLHDALPICPGTCDQDSWSTPQAHVELDFRLRRALDGFADPDIGAAATDVAGHLRVDIRIAGMRILGEKRRCRHDLSRLAVAALRHLAGEPGLLHRGSGARLAHALDGGD